MKRIVNWSGGLCSMFASHREIQRHGKANVINLFADTLYESPDLYEFNRRAEDLLGVEITRISVGLTPWELFRKEGMIGNNGRAHLFSPPQARAAQCLVTLPRRSTRRRAANLL